MRKPSPFKVVRPRRMRDRLLLMLIGGWMFIAGLGLVGMSEYNNSAGDAAQAPVRFPEMSRVGRPVGTATLLMFAHPRCPCTRASVGELALLMAQTRRPVVAYVIFLKPDGFQDDWVETDLWSSATSIPGVHAFRDNDGYDARLFHASTSGQTLLYDENGRLVFSGGITAARGHSGDNIGRSSIVAILNGSAAEVDRTPVYGCPLFALSECLPEKRQ